MTLNFNQVSLIGNLGQDDEFVFMSGRTRLLAGNTASNGYHAITGGDP